MIPRAGHAQAPSAEVFSTLQNELVPDIGVALEPATMRSRVVGVDTQRVAAARLGQETLRLNLFDDVAVAVRIDRVRPTRTGYFMSGRPEGFEWGEVRLVVNGPVMVGTVVTSEGKYTIRFGGSSRHIIRQVDPSAEPLEDDVVESPLPGSPPQVIAPGGPLPSSPFEAIPPGDPLGAVVQPATDTGRDQPTEDGSEVRVLVVYTPAMQTGQGGAAGMEALIDLMIHSANQAFETSGIDPRLVLAHTALVNYAEESTGTDLRRLVSSDDGHMDEIHALRNEYAADLVHLITRYVTGPGGRAGRLPDESLNFESTDAFAITASDSEETFAHETGHNFGLRHDRYRDGLYPPLYPYAYGYQNNRAFEPDSPASARWSTIMAYADRCVDAGFSCPRLMRFSNPDQTYRGDPLGVPADDPATGPEGPADARLAVNRTARWVGSFRSEACTEFAVSPETPVAPVDGGEVILQVETAPGCLWEASSQSAFLATAPETRHAGPGLVSIDTESNGTGAERIGAVTVAGKSVEIRQLATDAGICSRSPAVVRAIAGDAPCDEVSEEHLSRVAVLDLGNQGLAPLKAGDFAGLSSLESLSLEGNRLTELPTALFSGLSNLTDLNLRDNELNELPDGLFAGLSSLERLRLDRNRLTRLPQGLFSDLVNLQELDLSVNELSTLPDGLFAVLTGLRQLHLRQNQLSTLSNRPFAELPRLVVLDLANNQLSELPENFFDGLTALRTLYLSGNSFSAVPTGALESLSDLRHLLFCCNQLTNLPEGAFAGLSNLRWLNLSDNRITEFPPKLFAGLAQLSNLRIGRNNVTTLPDGLFSGLSALGALHLEENQLSSLPEGIFSGLSSLDQLVLWGNSVDPLPLGLTLEKVGEDRFKAVAPTGAPFELAIPISSDGGTIEGDAGTVTIPAGASESTPLGVTRVAGSRQRVTVDMGMLPELPNLHSGYVFEKDEALPLLVLPSNDPADATLSGLSLSRERLNPAFSPDTARYTASFPHSASSATVTLVTSHASATAAFHDENDDALPDADANADGFQVSLNQAETVVNVEVTAPDGTSTRTYTIVITREHNHCERTEAVLTAILASVPDVGACGGLRDAHLANIAILNLREKGIVSLKSGDFRGLTAMKTLALDINEITALPTGVFSGLYSLERLLLGSNQIESLPDNVFFGLVALRQITLGSNNLTSLPEEVFSGLSRLESLWISRNRMTHLDGNVFTELTSLRSLSLNDNDLTSLPAEVFTGLSGLRTLWLAGNELTNLPPNVFSGLISLQNLLLNGNDLRSLPAKAFSDSSELETLSLANNALTSLPPNVFSGLTVLQHLWLGGNQLTAVPDGLFAGLSNLRGLGLSGNAVDPLPISVSLQSLAGGRFKAVVPTGAPFALELSLSVDGGGRIEGDANTVTVPTGAVESAPLSVTRIDENTDTATVDIASLPALPREPEIHEGYVLTKSATLPVTITLPEDVPPPAQVTGVEVARGAGSLRVSWMPVTDADGYKVQWRSGEEDYEESRQAVISGGDTVSHMITGLAANTEYTVRVIATRAHAEDGPPSETVTGTPQPPPLDEVTGFKIRSRMNELRVSWSAVDNADGYKVQWRSGEEDYEESRQAVISGGDTLSYTITGLTAGTEYAVRVLATRDGEDDGPPSGEVTGTPRSGDPDVNGDGVLDGDDALVMYYAYAFAGSVGDGEAGGTAASRRRILAGYSGRTDPSDEELREMIRKANAWRTAGLADGGDINQDGVIDRSDAYAMHYAYRFENVLGNGEEGGTARFRTLLLGPLSGKADPTDEDLKEMLRRANRLREAFS